MLEIQKKVLKGLSSNRDFFKKELIKSFAYLDPEELEQFKIWVMDEFYDLYPDIINAEFLIEYNYNK